MIQWKVCQSWKQKWKNQPITRPWIEHCHWFILPLLLVTLTMEFSLDHKLRSHKRNQCFASDSVGLIFTRSYHSTLLITTPTMTPSLVQIQLQCIILFIRFPAWRLNWIRKLNRTFLCKTSTTEVILYFYIVDKYHGTLCVITKSMRTL